MDEKRLNMDILKEVLHGKRPHNDTLFLKWLDESEEHQRLYEEALTRAARDLYIKESFDRKGVWNKVLNETSKHDRVRFMRRRFMRVRGRDASFRGDGCLVVAEHGGCGAEGDCCR